MPSQKKNRTMVANRFCLRSYPWPVGSGYLLPCIEESEAESGLREKGATIAY